MIVKFHCPLVPPTSWKENIIVILRICILVNSTWTNLEKSVSQSLRASKARSRSSLSFLLLVLLMLSGWFSTLFSSIEPISSSPLSTPEKSGPNSCWIIGIKVFCNEIKTWGTGVLLYDECWLWCCPCPPCRSSYLIVIRFLCCSKLLIRSLSSCSQLAYMVRSKGRVVVGTISQRCGRLRLWVGELAVTSLRQQCLWIGNHGLWVGELSFLRGAFKWNFWKYLGFCPNWGGAEGGLPIPNFFRPKPHGDLVGILSQ